MKAIKLTSLPSWMDVLADDSLVTTADIRRHLKCSHTAIDSMLKSGRLPPIDLRQRDIVRQRSNGGICISHTHDEYRYWKAKTLRDFVKATQPTKPINS